MNALDLHFVAQLSVERLANCLAQGTVIALFAWLLLRMVGRRNSGTRFAVWFCSLLAIATVPFVEFSHRPSAAAHAVSAAIMMPRAWSLYLFSAWATIALLGLGSVAVGLWHLDRFAGIAHPSSLPHSILRLRRLCRTSALCGPVDFAFLSDFTCRRRSASSNRRSYCPRWALAGAFIR